MGGLGMGRNSPLKLIPPQEHSVGSAVRRDDGSRQPASGYAQPEGDVGRAAPRGRSMLGGITRAGFPATTLSGGTSDRMTAP